MTKENAKEKIVDCVGDWMAFVMHNGQDHNIWLEYDASFDLKIFVSPISHGCKF